VFIFKYFYSPNEIKMKKVIPLIALLFICLVAHTQDAKPIVTTYHVAIFSPLYLDSAFDGSFYRHGKGFPKFTQPGLDFVQGAQIALDSLPVTKGSVQANVYDSKAEKENIAWLIANHKLDSMDLLIGSVKDIELTQLASFAKQKNIPFISATSPNDGGITANPFFIMINSTLRAHCENIYSYILQKHGTDKIYLCRKKGSQEDKIADYFKTMNERDGKPLLTIETINFTEDYNLIQNSLDSNRTSIIIGASLNEDFAAGLATVANTLKDTYPLEIIGMPNWDAFGDLRKSALKDLPILYTATYYNSKTDIYSKKIQAVYSKKYRGAAMDMSYKGFEAVYVFAKLLTKFPDDFMSHLNEVPNKIFTEYNFKPVYNNKKADIPDYFENKHLFLMKIFNGKVTRVW
jgi:ABC-type branched-subunit amino acid transport system substrate-binding protein